MKAPVPPAAVRHSPAHPLLNPGRTREQQARFRGLTPGRPAAGARRPAEHAAALGEQPEPAAGALPPTPTAPLKPELRNSPPQAPATPPGEATRPPSGARSGNRGATVWCWGGAGAAPRPPGSTAAAPRAPAAGGGTEGCPQRRRALTAPPPAPLCAVATALPGGSGAPCVVTYRAVYDVPRAGQAASVLALPACRALSDKRYTKRDSRLKVVLI